MLSLHTLTLLPPISSPSRTLHSRAKYPPLLPPPIHTTQSHTHFLTHLPLSLLPTRPPLLRTHIPVPRAVPNQDSKSDSTDGNDDDSNSPIADSPENESQNDNENEDDDSITKIDDEILIPDVPPSPQNPNQTDTEDDEDDAEDQDDSSSSDSKPKTSSTTTQKNLKNKNTLYLALVFGFWYFQNVVFNIYNKKVLNVFPYPWLLASFQLLVGSLWMSFLWASKLQPYPKISKKFLTALLGPALFHTVGHISACVSFSKVAVSFTHVIKASEPVFSVIFSALHGQFYPIHVWLSVIPIVAGCSLAAVTEVSFNAQGLSCALISNVGFVLRNIYSKQSLYDFKHIDGLNLYGWISIVSFLYLFPVAVLVEGSQWAEGFRTAVGSVATPWSFYMWVLVSGVFYHLYNQSSYQALDKISPLTFSVGNTMKRVVVITASVLVFRNPIRPLNGLGSAIAVLGTFLYSQATMMGKGKKEGKLS